MIKINKTPLIEKDLRQIGIWDKRESFKKQLFRGNKQRNSVLIQGGAFVVNNHAYLLLGMGTIDILETMSQFGDIEGIIGTGNALFISRNFKFVYSVLSEKETLKRYEINKTHHPFKYRYSSKVAPLIILNRAFKNETEFKEIKGRKANKIIFDLGSCFFTKPTKYSGSIKARLRGKFIKTSTTVHCATHPTLLRREMVFDDPESIKNLINHFDGYFILGYMLWNEKFANSVGIKSNYSLDLKDNPSQIIGFVLIKLLENFIKSRKLLNRKKFRKTS